MNQKQLQDIEKILSISRHSPSSHNTQPWKVFVRNDQVYLGYNSERQLVVGDPDKRELFISLGCFAESFRLAAETVGYHTDVVFLGDSPREVAQLKLRRDPKITNTLGKIVALRRSDRRYYLSKSLDGESLTKLKGLSEKFVTQKLYTSDSDIAFLAEVTHDATFRTMSDPQFRAELASWIRHNWTKEPDGMPAYVQGIPGPISLLAKKIVAKGKMVAKDQAKKDSERIKRSAAVALLCVDSEKPASWFAAGKLYQRLCLTAQKDGIHTTGLSAAVIDTTTNGQIKDKLALTQTPVAMIRFGYAKKAAKPSPRLQVNQFLSVE